MRLLIISLLLYTNVAMAQNATDISPEKTEWSRYQEIIVDGKGNIYVFHVQSFHDKNGTFHLYDGREWKNITSSLPGTASLKGIKPTSNGFAFIGANRNWDPVNAIFHDGVSKEIPLKMLQGRVADFNVDKNNIIWFLGSFGPGSTKSAIAKLTGQEVSFHSPIKGNEDATLDAEYIYPVGPGKDTYVIQFQKLPGKTRLFDLVSPPGKIIIGDEYYFPVQFSQNVVALNADYAYVVGNCANIKNRCMLQWKIGVDTTWQLLPFNDAFLNDEVNAMTFDGDGNLLVAGKTRSSAGYVILCWNGTTWSQFGPPTPHPFHNMVWNDNKVYAITGEKRENVVMIPAYTTPVAPIDHQGKFMIQDKKMAEVWQVSQEAQLSIETFMRTIITLSNNFESSPVVAQWRQQSNMLEAAMKKCQKDLKKLKLKQGQNSLADLLAEKLYIFSTLQTDLSIFLSTLGMGYPNYAKSLKESLGKAEEVFKRYVLSKREYKQRHGL
jgi:hypothetical protein